MIHDHIEPWTGAPTTLWINEGLLPIIWIVALLWLIWRSVKSGEAIFGLLALVGFSSMFWQDGFINWGMYLLYNPHQTLMPWGPTPFTAPRKVWWTIGGYGVFFLGMIPVTLALANVLRRRFSGLGKTTAIILIGMPIFYLWDLLLEGQAVKGGFYSYVSYWGPALKFEMGNMPVLFPITFIAAWATAAVLLVSWKSADGHARFESWFGVQRIASTPLREIARVGIWVLVLNIFHILFAIVPLTLIRVLFLEPSPLVP